MTRISIPQQVLDLSAKEKNLIKAWNRYVEVNKKYINKTHLKNESHNYDDRQLTFPLAEAAKECGKIRIDGKHKWVWHLFFDLYPFFKIYRKGDRFTGQTTKIIPIKKRFREIRSVSSVLEEFFPEMTAKEISALPMVPVDLKSLGDFIQNANPDDIKQARAIADITRECQTTGITKKPALPYDINPSPFGRTYHQGVNLQTCKKEIREAALGKCWEYDLNGAVIAVKLTILEKIYDETGDDIDKCFIASKEYLTKKTTIRKQLADVLYKARLARHKSAPKNNAKPTKAKALADIKKSCTAISFGADTGKTFWFGKKGVGIQYSAFATIIPDNGDREDVLNARGGFLRQFEQEQKEMTKVIVAHFLADKANQAEIANTPEVFGSRLSKPKIMAYIYQTKETGIMDKVEAGIVAKLKPNPVILRVHDGFYSTRKIPKAMIQGILDKIQYENCKDFRGFITASETRIDP